MLFEHPSDRSLYHPAAWKELGAGVAHRPCWRGASQNWTKEHLLDKTECENKQQPSRKETKLIYVWEKIFVAALLWSENTFVGDSQGFSSHPLWVPTSLVFISLSAYPRFYLTSGDDRIVSEMFLLRFLVWLLRGHALQLFAGLLLK